MPKTMSGLRIARSYITPENTEVKRELDFQLGGDDGIAIYALIGSMTINTEAASSTMTAITACQTLHVETGSLEDVPVAAAEDEDTIDTEQIFRQDAFVVAQDNPSAASPVISPGGVLYFQEPIFTARNLTHRGKGSAATWSWGMHLTIHYKFVRFSLSELGVILARRS
jgi:hypothetical protein